MHILIDEIISAKAENLVMDGRLTEVMAKLINIEESAKVENLVMEGRFKEVVVKLVNVEESLKEVMGKQTTLEEKAMTLEKFNQKIGESLDRMENNFLKFKELVIAHQLMADDLIKKIKYDFNYKVNDFDRRIDLLEKRISAIEFRI